VEFVRGNFYGGEPGIGDFDSFLIGSIVNRGTDTESLLGSGCSDQIDDDLMAYQWATPPVHADERKQAVFDFVPLAGAGREVAHADCQAQFVGKLLQFQLPETNP